MSTGSVM